MFFKSLFAATTVAFLAAQAAAAPSAMTGNDGKAISNNTRPGPLSLPQTLSMLATAPTTADTSSAARASFTGRVTLSLLVSDS
ncbi:hypothetical protein NX059_000331 [Plenodomus lindquistii]|nr:hypothetical protein NX059_000331 [Plenodomus lindquistii]